MSKVTSKLQVTIPKVIAEQFKIQPGDEIEWVPAGDAIRVIPEGRSRPSRDIKERLKLFDQATGRQREREKNRPRQQVPGEPRGWTRDELYQRG